MDRVWENVLDVVEEKIGKTNTETWLKPARPIGLRGDTFHLEVPSPLFREWLLNNLLEPLEASLASVLGQTAQVAIHVHSGQQGELFPADDAPTQAVAQDTGTKRRAKPASKPQAPPKSKGRQTKKSGLLQNFTFANFVVGGGNQFAHAAARAVADHPGNHYNPLFIYGGVGLGKTHLINAIGHESLVAACFICPPSLSPMS